MLVGFAATLFAFIVLVERQLHPSAPQGNAPSRLFSFRASEVTNVQLRVTNELRLRVERNAADEGWSLSLPFHYPAQGQAIEWVLRSLEELAPVTFIPQRELTAGKRTLADYGLDVPPATLTLYFGGQRKDILFGTKTPVGDQVYLQVLDRPGVYLVPAELYDRLPRNHNDWRDTLLFGPIRLQRMDVRAASRGYTVEFTENGFRVTRPTMARADAAKIQRLLEKVVLSQVTQFVTENSPRVDLEQYGLQPPELEVAFGIDTNDLKVVQFGRSPTNDATLVYARRMMHTNIVLVSREILDSFQTTFSDLRDLHLVSIPPSGLDSIEVTGSGNFTENFVVRRGTNGAWTIGDNTTTQSINADAGVMQKWIDDLARLEGAIEKDVVTDFKTLYNLDPPARRYALKTSLTNASGTISNQVVGTLELGARQENKVFARRPDEATVYSLSPKDVARLPYAVWQLRERRVWSFTTNQISRVKVRHLGLTKTIQRSPTGSWGFIEGSQGIIIPGPLEEMMFRLGELRASAWVAQGTENKGNYGFRDTGDQITFELRNGDRPRTLVLEFGDDNTRRAATGFPYAMSVADGQTLIFEFPPALYIDLLRNLFNQMFPASMKTGGATVDPSDVQK